MHVVAGGWKMPKAKKSHGKKEQQQRYGPHHLLRSLLACGSSRTSHGSHRSTVTDVVALQLCAALMHRGQMWNIRPFPSTEGAAGGNVFCF